MHETRDAIDIPVRLLHDLAVKLRQCSVPQRGDHPDRNSERRISGAEIRRRHLAAARNSGRLTLDELTILMREKDISRSNEVVRISQPVELLRIARLIIRQAAHPAVGRDCVDLWFTGGTGLPQIMTLTAHAYQK